MKCRYPDVFAAAMLNAQPLGFYAPAQLVRDAREHGVELREVDVNLSDWDCTLEPLPSPHRAFGRTPVSRRAMGRGVRASPHPALRATFSQRVKASTPATPRWRRTSARPMRCA